jgi:hypothetical protein
VCLIRRGNLSSELPKIKNRKSKKKALKKKEGEGAKIKGRLQEEGTHQVTYGQA